MAGRTFRLTRRDGYSLHSLDSQKSATGVPADHWCVTRKDMNKFRREVVNAIDMGILIPSAGDPFDPRDRKIGPSVHTVVVQMLKAVEQMSGGASYALIQNPNGIRCDLFVTHGWAEGVFEFIDKVLHSWPFGARGAYCCMLSNPQTLDIGDMIASPIKSPFAMALRSATHVLVVPNRKTSLYTRSWCVYEVFLAYKWDKVVMVAMPPESKFRVTMLLMAISVIASVVFHELFVLEQFSEHANDVGDIYACLLDTLKMITVFAPTQWTKEVDVLGAFVAAGHLAFAYHHPSPKEKVVGTPLYLIAKVLDGLVFVCSDIDRSRHIRLKEQEAQLRRGYTGHVCKSEASVLDDRDKILAEIREKDEEAKVDESVGVLLRSGMVTSSLRTAHEMNVDISSIGLVKLECWIVSVSSWVWVSIYCMEKNSTARGAVCFAFLVIWLASFIVRYRRDLRALSAVAGWKLVGLPMAIASTADLVLDTASRISGAPPKHFLYGAMSHLVPALACVAAVISFSRLDYVAQIPFVGRVIAQFLVTEHFQCCKHQMLRRSPQDAALESCIELHRW